MVLCHFKIHRFSKNVLFVDNPLPIPVRSTPETENFLDHKPKILEKSYDHYGKGVKNQGFFGKKTELLKNGHFLDVQNRKSNPNLGKIFFGILLVRP
jgi:hypothetical protein